MKKLAASLLVIFSTCCVFAISAKAVVKEAASKDTLEQSVAYLQKTVPSMEVPAEKRSAYGFMGSVYEQMGNYGEAIKAYAQAAAIAAADGEGMPKRSSEQLVLDAVRCALCQGDWSTAGNYLNSAVRNSSESVIVSYVKLYEQWSALCRAEKSEDTAEAVAMLKTYSTLDSMKNVRPQILLTLWHITGQSAYAEQLKKSYSATPEAAVARGDIQTLPAPFWYFVPRAADVPENTAPAAAPVAKNDTTVSGTASQLAAASAAEKKEEKTPSDKTRKQQLGLFRDKANAESLVNKLKNKGFAGKITTELRPSGTTYYIVAVDENKDSTMGDQLRDAGFECYPVFE